MQPREVPPDCPIAQEYARMEARARQQAKTEPRVSASYGYCANEFLLAGARHVADCPTCLKFRKEKSAGARTADAASMDLVPGFAWTLTQNQIYVLGTMLSFAQRTFEKEPTGAEVAEAAKKLLNDLRQQCCTLQGARDPYPEWIIPAKEAQ